VFFDVAFKIISYGYNRKLTQSSKTKGTRRGGMIKENDGRVN
jgi:hypothetical protein